MKRKKYYYKVFLTNGECYKYNIKEYNCELSARELWFRVYDLKYGISVLHTPTKNIYCVKVEE